MLNSPLLLCGHRGVASLAPENTLAGLKAAHDLGLSWVEIDVQLTNDLQPVLLHDATVNRCSNGRGRLRDYDYQQLSELDAGSWFDARFASEKIPLLADYLVQAAHLNIKVNIELKVHSGDNETILCERVAHVIEKACQPNTLLLSSFSETCLANMQSLLPHIARGILFEKLPAHWQSPAQQLNVTSIHCHHRHLTLLQAQQIKAAGYQLYCYTVNSPRRAARLARWGVDMIFTDKPQNIKTSGQL
ncbi:MAG: glycerophosphoryl diester phosphodiesterase [Aeromonadales bacterium]|nr:glycerophosphoryl diester phosphodiesterase [Aeromonadales bacterium]